MELMVPLKAQWEVPLYEQIYLHVKGEIRQGRLKASVKLPSTRALAEHLKVSRSTTQMAYDQLLSEGYVEAVPCKGYFVADMEGLVDTGQEGAAYGQAPLFERNLGTGQDWKAAFLVDFSPRGIDLNAFPFHAWRKLTRNTLMDGRRELFAPGDPQGEPALREAIASYLHSARGVNCTGDQVIVGAGTEYLLMLLHLVLGRNRRIAMENPTYKQAYRVFQSLGYQVEPVEMDQQGMDVGVLEGSGADTAYVMPSHQYPTGIVMPIKRRQELLSWAGAALGRYLIEDDYDSEFRYKGKPVPALQGLDRHGRVIYLGTFSKSIAPAIRVSYMVLPVSLMAIYRERFRFYASTVSRIDQDILFQFLSEGHYERHLNRMRAIYKGKHDVLVAALRPFEPWFHIRGEYAGLHLLLTCKDAYKGKADEEELVRRARQAKVRVYGMSDYFIQPAKGQPGATVLLGYANLAEADIHLGARLLKEAWNLGTEGVEEDE